MTRPPPFRNLFLLSLFAVPLLLSMQSTLASEALVSGELPAADIIHRMRAVYASSESYSDSGTVTEDYIQTFRKRTVEKHFTTAFIRPGRFRFEFRERIRGKRDRRFIIHRDNMDVQVYWDLDRNLQHDSLDRAIASATGISGESAITVPAMLLPKDIVWRRAIKFHRPRRIEDDRLGGLDCFRIQDAISGGDATYWIGKQDYLLRKIYYEKDFGDFLLRRTTTYAPLLNRLVTDSMLEFGSPPIGSEERRESSPAKKPSITLRPG